jgi:hypothetical protein
MGDLLHRQTARSALVLRRILGPVRLSAVRPEVGRPYYQVETALEILDLLDEASEGGSNWLQQWRRGESNPRPKVHTRVSPSVQASPSTRNSDDGESGSHQE